MNEYLLAGMFGVIMALIEVVKYLIQKREEKSPNGCKKPCEIPLQKMERKIDDLHAWHNAKDSEGYPLFYVPRGWSETQKDVVEKLQSITLVLNNIIHILETLERRVESKKTVKGI